VRDIQAIGQGLDRSDPQAVREVREAFGGGDWSAPTPGRGVAIHQRASRVSMGRPLGIAAAIVSGPIGRCARRVASYAGLADFTDARNASTLAFNSAAGPAPT
jgi:hypothetical protein